MGLQLPSPPLRLKRCFQSPWEVFNWVISSELFLLNDHDTPTFLHRSSGSRSSRHISFASSSFTLPCSWEVLQDLGSDHLPILLSVLLSTLFRPNERPPSFNFQKTRWDSFDELARRGVLLAPFAIPCSLSPLISRIHSFLGLETYCLIEILRHTGSLDFHRGTFTPSSC